MKGEFKIGDVVQFVNETGTGTIVRFISDTRVVVEDEDEFEVEYALAEIVPLTSYDDYDDLSSARPKESAVTLAAPIKKDKNEHFLEIDLHIHELLENWRHMSNHEIVQYQMDTFRTWMERAREDRIRKIVFIHGVGEGKLRYEIQNRLRHYAGVDFHDGKYKDYGYGATEVYFRGF